ncbi:MAG TPA: hypothetical protein VMU98_08365 [Acidimicrobiales bacterium]|nr:hypothetical protein [Acidimicrobiales bacterium]
MVLGAAVAAALMVSMQLPLLHAPSGARVTMAPWPTNAAPKLAWPSAGPAALDIPSLGVLRTHADRVVPIASLTKMMTAYVTLKRLPLSMNENGTCQYVSSSDVATYDAMKLLDESSVAVVVGEQICEYQLLEGLLVHSAGNYAVMLADMVAGSPDQFVALMNQQAVALGLTQTHYADVSGFSASSVSSARDQARLAVLLMKSPLVRSIVIQPSVDLPVGGVQGSFTPYVGIDHVIGVKSGRTSAAGGCDVLAMTFRVGTKTRVLYAVILGARGGDLLGPAGDEALALANTAAANQIQHVIPRGTLVARVGWDHHETAAVTAHAIRFTWWAAKGRPRLILTWRRFTNAIRRGQVVGAMRVEGTTSARVSLVAARRVAPATLWQRLR